MSKVVTGLVSSLLILSLVANLYLGAYFVASISGPTESVYTAGDKNQRIVIIPVKGMIGDETAAFIHSALRSLKDNAPKAIVLRIDSPGGGVSASDRIWHELKKFKEQTGIPIVASYGSIAASGGYYISAMADHIMVEPTTLTGSIGVIAQAFTIEALMGKIGVTPETVVSTGSTDKDILNSFRNWTEADRTELRKILDEAYERFVTIVDEGRKTLDIDEVRKLATGKPYTAREALSNKLADSEGYLDAAIEQARTLAGVSEDAQVTVLSPPKSIGLLGVLGKSADPASSQITAEQLRGAISEMVMPRLEYRMIP